LNDVLGKSQTGQARRDVLRNAAKTGEWVFDGSGADAEKSAVVRDRARSI
jgi:hypothetical protein